MDKNFIKEQKKKLEEEKEKIEKQLQSFAKKAKVKKGKTKNWLTKMPYFNGNKEEEEADQLEEYEKLIALEDSLETQLRDIDLALKKIKENTYGICEKCGKEIEKERLTVLPQARTCLKCANNKK
jgi:DnaK suppressor protein